MFNTCMARSPETNAALRRKSREKILAAAVRLFARRGYGGTTVRAIADEAGVAPGLLYAHFASKQELLAALLRESFDDVGSTIDEADREPTAEGFVRSLLKSAIRAVDARRDAWRLNYVLRHQIDVAADAGGVQTLTAVTRELLAEALHRRRVPNADAEALVLFALVDGICQHFVMRPDEYPVDDVIAAAAARYTGFERRPR